MPNLQVFGGTDLGMWFQMMTSLNLQPFFCLSIRREHILQDTLRAFCNVSENEIKLPLKVTAINYKTFSGPPCNVSESA